MKLIISLAISLFSIMGVFSQEVIGSWQGTLKTQGIELEIVFHIEKQDSGYTSLMDSPTQGAFGIPTTKTTFKNEQIEIVVANLGVFYQGKLKNDSITGTFNQSGLSIPLTLERTEKKELVRPQTPKAPYPYEVEEITFTNLKEKIELAGTFTLPKGKEKVPAVILISGSGPNDRDETIFNHKPFWVLADYLTRRGIAVLRYDKRGVDKSGGEYFTATTQDFADDAEAGLNYLKTRKEIDVSNLGLIGHSEGGIIAPMIAARNNDVKFIVLMAGLGVSGAELSLAQNQFTFNKTSMMEKEKEELDKILRDIYKSVIDWSEYVGSENERSKLKKELEVLWEKLPKEIQSQVNKEVFVEKTTSNIASPWFRSFLKTDPLVYLENISIPVLAINGENDTQVEYQVNLNKIDVALKKANNKHYTIKSYPQLNHLFQESTTGELDEYGKIEQTISPEVLSDVTNWILEQVK